MEPLSGDSRTVAIAVRNGPLPPPATTTEPSGNTSTSSASPFEPTMNFHVSGSTVSGEGFVLTIFCHSLAPSLARNADTTQPSSVLSHPIVYSESPSGDI